MPGSQIFGDWNWKTSSFTLWKECCVKKSEGNKMDEDLGVICPWERFPVLPVLIRMSSDANRWQSVFCESPEKGLGIHQPAFWCEERHCGALRLTFCQMPIHALLGDIYVGWEWLEPLWEGDKKQREDISCETSSLAIWKSRTGDAMKLRVIRFESSSPL